MGVMGNHTHLIFKGPISCKLSGSCFYFRCLLQYVYMLLYKKIYIYFFPLILSIAAVPLFTLCLNCQFKGLSLSAHPPTKNPICSDWLALTGLSKHHPNVSVMVFATMAMLRTWQRAVTVYLWHHNLTEVPAALLKIQFLNVGCVQFYNLLFWYFKSNFIAPRPLCRPVTCWNELHTYTEILNYIHMFIHRRSYLLCLWLFQRSGSLCCLFHLQVLLVQKQPSAACPTDDRHSETCSKEWRNRGTEKRTWKEGKVFWITQHPRSYTIIFCFISLVYTLFPS